MCIPKAPSYPRIHKDKFKSPYFSEFNPCKPSGYDILVCALGICMWVQQVFVYMKYHAAVTYCTTLDRCLKYIHDGTYMHTALQILQIYSMFAQNDPKAIGNLHVCAQRS